MVEIQPIRPVPHKVFFKSVDPHRPCLIRRGPRGKCQIPMPIRHVVFVVRNTREYDSCTLNNRHVHYLQSHI